MGAHSLAKRAALMAYCEIDGAAGSTARQRVVERIQAAERTGSDPFANQPADLAADRLRLYESVLMNLCARIRRSGATK